MNINGKIQSSIKPEPIDSANKIINATLRGDMITAHVLCSVEYEGRAESTIEKGDRVILIKPDGTVLVHGDENYQPINWQSPGAEVTADLDENNNLVILAEDSEYLEITCYDVYGLTVFDNTDEAELDLRGTEEEMHRRIMENPSIVEKGLHDVEHEKEFSFGRVDVFGYDSDGEPVIIEVKRRSATRDHVYQLYTYLKEYKEKQGSNVRGILVAPNCTEYIYDVIKEYGLEYVSLDPLE